uniref:PIPO n=1 Tax=Gongylonema pulchrum TaxID=637853 RepID=A0A183DIA5_9BILA
LRFTNQTPITVYLQKRTKTFVLAWRKVVRDIIVNPICPRVHAGCVNDSDYLRMKKCLIMKYAECLISDVR